MKKPLFGELFNQLNQQLVAALGLLNADVLTVAQHLVDKTGGKVKVDAYGEAKNVMLNVHIDTQRDLGESVLETLLMEAMATTALSARIETHTDEQRHPSYPLRRHAVAYVYADNRAVRFDLCSVTKAKEQREAA
ncbi:hypothetical protein NH8B_1941 [Pseudogulbenkiania sp. NH8B]|uniref:hypothetical protein n=1 Tax=Pseudogulbenkiania sp. (strain NH8B) TaxID=748280 RepID=UPI0002279FE2|nr:hypothetical protein [Pseudogulbenkiania sp. NH8B]BAK76756.1 hypothetical protein NH8B_1941 [Pseudogulbenkiania sp. NH8B]